MLKEVRVQRVTTKKEIREFIYLPRKIYLNDELWVPPLWFLEKMDYQPKSNAVLERSEHVLFLVYEDGRPVGRILAYIDPRHNSYFGIKRGLFGSFESVENDKVGDLLFSSAEEWLKEKGMTEILGPINPVAESWGFLLKGSTPPIFMSPHNPLYYNRLIENQNYKKAKDLLVSEADQNKGYKIPDRFSNFADKILSRRDNISVRPINTKKLKEEALFILAILNKSVEGNWGYVPVEEDEMMEIVDKLKLILDKNAIWFVEDEGVPVGVALGFPDINVAFKKMNGRLTPSTIITLLKERKRIKDYRLWGLAVNPEYHGQGLDVLLYVSLARALAPKGVRMEANYMLEDNYDILNALEKMGLKEIKKYRVYQKQL